MKVPTVSPLPTPLVSTAWLAAELGAPDLRIFDCSVVRRDNPDGTYAFVSGRSQWEAAHIPGSQFLDVPGELSDPQAATSLMMPAVADFARTMAEKGVGEGTRVLLYDNSNHAWAARVWWMLRVCGFDAAAVLDGGWQKWQAEARPSVTGGEAYSPARFTPQPRPQLLAGKQDVLAALGRRGVALIHALPPPIFEGKVRAFPRPGRIPGSRNVWCDSLVDPVTRTYKPHAQLRQAFATSGALAADRVITYCGGGIAASSDALALVALGVENVAVYDGSLAEWTADPSLPLETA